MLNQFKLILSFVFLLSIHLFVTPGMTAQGDEGIDTYSIKYDVKSTRNKIVDENLLMIPAENEFRTNNFSQVTVSGTLPASPGESKAVIDRRIRDHFFKTILLEQGLKSVKVKDHDTVVSYEGAVITPVKLLKTVYQADEERYSYTAQVEFSPIAFPDQWKRQYLKHRARELFDDFLHLFK